MMFPMRFSSSSFYTFSGSEKKEALQNISFVHVFFQKKDEDLCHFQSGTFRIFFQRFPTNLEDSGFTASTQMEESHRESTEDLLCQSLVALNRWLP